MDFYVVRIFDAPVRGPGFGPDFSLSGLVVGPVREALGPLTENAIMQWAINYGYIQDTLSECINSKCLLRNLFLSKT